MCLEGIADGLLDVFLLSRFYDFHYATEESNSDCTKYDMLLAYSSIIT